MLPALLEAVVVQLRCGQCMYGLGDGVFQAGSYDMTACARFAQSSRRDMLSSDWVAGNIGGITPIRLPAWQAWLPTGKWGQTMEKL